MSQLATATSANEIPTFFSAGQERLFGIMTLPTGPPAGAGVLLLNAASWIPAIGKNRLWVRIARGLAAQGYHVLRFDYHGVGESTGQVDEYRLDESFETDVRAAVGEFVGRGVHDIVAVGWCFGARLGLMCAPRIPQISGVVALSLLITDSEGAVTDPKTNPPVLRRAFKRETFKRLLHPQYRGIYWRVIKGRVSAVANRLASMIMRRSATTDKWASRGFIRDMRAAVQAGSPVVAVFGQEEPFYSYFEEARAGVLGSLLHDAGARVRVEVLGNDVKRLVQVPDQDLLVDAMAGYVDWVHASGNGTVDLTR